MQPRPVRKDRVLKPWKQQEVEAAEIMGGEKTRGSGCGKQKGDVKNRFALGECKTTSKESYRIEKEVLCKLCREAGKKVPVFVFGFDRMPRRFSADWFAVPAAKFDVICSVLNAVAEGDLEEAQRWLNLL